MSFIVLYIPCPNEASAKKIAGQLLENRLIACANISQGMSMYEWEGNSQTEEEVYCLMKTTKWASPKAQAMIEKLHPYEVPCVMQWEVSANKKYEEWIRACVDLSMKDTQRHA